MKQTVLGFRRLIAVLLTAAISLIFMAGCQNGSGGYLTINGKKIKVNSVLTIDSEKISLAEFRYFYLSIKEQADSSSAKTIDWENDKDSQKQLRESTLEQIKRYHALEKLAQEKGVSLTKAEQTEIDTKIKETFEQYGTAKEFNAYLESIYATKNILGYMYEIQELYTKLETKLFGKGGSNVISDDAVKAAVKENYVRFFHIFIPFDSSAEDTTKDKAEKKSTADKVSAKIKAGGDYAKLLAEYGEDSNLTDNPDGYYYTKEDFSATFEGKTDALKVGDISEPIESDYGYHIVKRDALEDTYIETNMDTFRSTMQSEKLNEMITGVMDKFEVKLGEAYASITPTTLK